MFLTIQMKSKVNILLKINLGDEERKTGSRSRYRFLQRATEKLRKFNIFMLFYENLRPMKSNRRLWPWTSTIQFKHLLYTQTILSNIVVVVCPIMLKHI